MTQSSSPPQPPATVVPPAPADAPAPAGTPVAVVPHGSATAAANPAAEPVTAGRRYDTRNVIVLTMCGVVIVTALLLITFFTNHYNQPKRDLNSEFHAPDYQTSPERIQMSYGEWYLKRAREAFDRKDLTTCRMMLEDLNDMLKRDKYALSPEGQVKLKDLVEDFSSATSPIKP